MLIKLANLSHIIMHYTIKILFVEIEKQIEEGLLNILRLINQATILLCN